jgi:hypothetical protein
MLVRIAICGAMLAAACTDEGKPTGIEPLECPPEGTTLTYANFGEPLISSNCTARGCHDRRVPVLTTQDGVQAAADDILDAAVYTDAMPRTGTMTIDDRRLLGEWLVCGAP